MNKQIQIILTILIFLTGCTGVIPKLGIENDQLTPCPTNKVRLCERSEPQSEPFVGQARHYIENIFFG
ncbi:MAG: hypothetical protein QTN59_02690 [Candidatus Electrothrix communis]|nr:MAG: hypothetical protein QTN59_02690 [Candidatus Electrothrix communis]